MSDYLTIYKKKRYYQTSPVLWRKGTGFRGNKEKIYLSLEE
jgi:hypothetical protein